MKFILISIVLASNYLLSWTYNQINEEYPVRQDTVLVPASHQYDQMSPAKWFFMGSNYRKEWSVPVKVPVFYLNTTKGGFTIQKLGGGQQTRSLHLIHRDGSKWIARSVDKNVRNALPPALQGTFIQGLVQDQISAAYPYANLTMYELSKAAGIPAPTVELYYIPNDSALGDYRSVFAHSVVFLSPKHIEGNPDTESTDDMEELIDSTAYYQIRQNKVLYARLFDMLIADWDRHQGQWEWAFTDSGHTMYISPVPEDRDQAFFLSHGVLTQTARLFGLPHLIGFKESPKNLKKLNNKVHDFDRRYLGHLSRTDWENTIRDFQSKMTDEAIDSAIRKLPEEVYAISGTILEHKLKNRRDGLYREGMKYYDFLAAKAVVHSSRSAELFRIIHYGDSTRIVMKRAKDNRRIFQRTFHKAETKEINIYGIGSNDTIDIGRERGIHVIYHRTE